MKSTFAGGHTLGGHDVVRFGPLRFWAERGLVHVEDSRDNSYESLSVATTLRRMDALSEMLGNSSRREMMTEDQFDQANRLRHMNMLEGMTAVVGKAREQGMPTDRSAINDLKRRRATTVVMSGSKYSSL